MRERQTDRQIDRQADRRRERQRKKKVGTERERDKWTTLSRMTLSKMEYHFSFFVLCQTNAFLLNVVAPTRGKEETINRKTRERREGHRKERETRDR